MNVLGKVLVVLVLILSVAFATSQMILHQKRENFGRMWEEQRQARKQAEQKLTEAEGTVEDLKTQLDDVQQRNKAQIDQLSEDKEQLQTRVADLEKETQNLTTSVTTLTDRANKLEGRVESRDETIAELRSTVEQRDATIQEKLAEIDQKQGELAQRREKIDDLTYKLAQKEEEYRKLAQREDRLTAVVAELRERGVQIPPTPAPPINGLVVRVDHDNDVAVVNRGADAGVKPNMEFTIYEDGDYVGRLVILRVQPQVSAGRISLLAEGRKVQQGQNVTTEVQ